MTPHPIAVVDQIPDEHRDHLNAEFHTRVVGEGLARVEGVTKGTQYIKKEAQA